MIKKIPLEALKKEVKVLLDRNTPAAAIKKVISQKTGYKKTKTREVFNDLILDLKENNELPISKLEETQWENDLVSTKPYFFNEKTRQYITFLNRAARNIVVPEQTHLSILEAYSNFDNDPRSINEISRTFKFPRAYLEEYLKIFGITHDSVPVSSEILDEKTEEEIVEGLKERKQWSILQKFEKQSWIETLSDSEKWNQFKLGVFNPIEQYLNSWTPPKLIPLKYKPILQDRKSDKTYCIAISDLHYGAEAKARYMFNRPEWNTQKTVECVDRFATEIINEVDSRKYKYNKCVILSLGDLIHSLDGSTGRGTPLKYDCVREEQFDYALDSLLTFISRMVECFGECEVYSTYGNHNYETEMALFRALDMFFRKDKRIKFTHFSSRPAAFKVNKTLLICDHGADHREKAYVPGIGPKLEKHVNTLLANNPELLIGVKSKLFCVGDKHHFCHIEYASFEFLMFSTLLGGCEHANVNNLHNRARQSCMILDNSGLREVIHTYFD